jgi:hypothetical protein
VALLVAATAVYLLVNDWFGPLAGMLAGVAYVYAPYQLFNLFLRGSLPVIWALASFRGQAFSRLVRTAGRYLPLRALILGAALLMHNISSLLSSPSSFFIAFELFYITHYVSFYVLLRAAALYSGFSLLPSFGCRQRTRLRPNPSVITPDFDYHPTSLCQLFLSLPQQTCSFSDLSPRLAQ